MRKWIGPAAQFCESSHCVEVSQAEGEGFYVRASGLKQFKIFVTPAEFEAFVESAKAGHYDGLLKTKGS